MADEVRLINAEKLKRQLIEGDGHDDDRFTEGYNFAINEIRGYIDDMPTIEAELDKGWISVKDRLPEYDKTVLVVNEDGYMHTAVRIKGSIAMIDEWQIKFGVYFNDNDVWDEDEQGKITHWRLLPEPPKGE